LPATVVPNDSQEVPFFNLQGNIFQNRFLGSGIGIGHILYLDDIHYAFSFSFPAFHFITISARTTTTAATTIPAISAVLLSAQSASHSISGIPLLAISSAPIATAKAIREPITTLPLMPPRLVSSSRGHTPRRGSI